MKAIQDMTVEEIVDHLILDRGLDAKDPKLRKAYNRALVQRAKDGDLEALNSLLRIGSHFSKPVRMDS
jgi:ABC-type amino acid transport substrate-binding protein